MRLTLKFKVHIFTFISSRTHDLGVAGANALLFELLLCCVFVVRSGNAESFDQWWGSIVSKITEFFVSGGERVKGFLQDLALSFVLEENL